MTHVRSFCRDGGTPKTKYRVAARAQCRILEHVCECKRQRQQVARNGALRSGKGHDVSRRPSYDLSVQKYVMTIRAHEFSERQRVSMLEIEGLGRGRIRALWKAGITTTEKLLATASEDVVQQVSEHLGGVRAESVEDWKRQIAELVESRQGRVLGPLGWDHA